MLQFLHSHLGTFPSGPAPYLSPLVSPMGMYPNIPLRGGRAAWDHQPWPGIVPAIPCQPLLPSLIPPFSSSAFTYLQPKVPPGSAACQGECNTSFSLLLLLFYCPRRMQFSPAPTDQGLSQERTAQEILPKTIGTLPFAAFPLLQVWPLSPAVSL